MRKVMELNDGAHHLVCIKTETSSPYRLYRVWWDGGTHRKQIAACSDMKDVMAWVSYIIRQ